MNFINLNNLIFMTTLSWEQELFNFSATPAGIIAWSTMGVLFTIVLVLVTLSVKRRKFHRRILNEIEKEFAAVSSIGIEDRLNKIATIGNLNSVFMHAHRDFSKRYQEFLTTQGAEIQKDISTFKTILQEKDYSKSLSQANQIRVKLTFFRDSLNELYTNLIEITRGEEENLRELKLIHNTYDACRSLFMGHPEDYDFLVTEFNQLFNQIDDKKDMVEAHLRTGDYIDAKEVLVAMKNDVNALYYFLTNLPPIIRQAHREIPQKINDLIDRFEAMKSEEFPLGHLRFTMFVDSVKQELSLVYKKLQGFQTNGIEEMFIGFDKQIIEMKQRFDEEVRARTLYDAKCNEINDQAIQFESQFFNRFTRELKEIKEVFDIDGALQLLIKEIHVEINRMSQLRRSLDNSIYSLQPFTLRVLRMEELAKQVEIVRTKIDAYQLLTSSMRDNSESAYDRIEQSLIILKSIELDIRMLRIYPILSQFNESLNEANLQIQELDRCLKTVPIKISLMNQLTSNVDGTLTHLQTLAKKTISDAKYAEQLILFGNRYRSSFQDVEISVVTAETAFKAGDFDHAVATLSTSLSKFNLPLMAR